MTKSKSTAATTERRAGALLAAKMFREFAKAGVLEQCTVEDDFRKTGSAQRDIVGRYMRRLTSPAMTAGFTAILTHYLAVQAHAGDPDLDWIELLAARGKEAKAIWLGRRTAEVQP